MPFLALKLICGIWWSSRDGQCQQQMNQFANSISAIVAAS